MNIQHHKSRYQFPAFFPCLRLPVSRLPLHLWIGKPKLTVYGNWLRMPERFYSSGDVGRFPTQSSAAVE